MKIILKKSLIVLVLPFTSLMADAQLDFSSLVNEFMDESNGLKTTINLSGKQRMLTQLMSKLAIQIDLNIQKEVSKTKLIESALAYDVTLKNLKEGDSELGISKTTNKKVLEKIAIVEKEWALFHKATQNINDKSLAYIIQNNEKLLKISNELVKAYEASNTSKNYLETARLSIVNIAGRQRMLTQKMTKEKLLVLKADKEYGKKLLKTIELFDTTLTALINGDKERGIAEPSNKKIIKQLKVVATMWGKLKPLYLKKKNTARELAVIISKNPLLLKEMNTMVLLAEKEVEY